jgi:two-component system chemotaxis response regulator CheB
MAGVKVVRHWLGPASPPSTRPAAPLMMAKPPARIVAIAASTGGPAALQVLLSGLPATFPAPILVVQHIGKGFVDGLVTWLNTVSSLKVRVAVAGEPIMPHTVYVAPDDAHLGVVDRGRIGLSRSEPIGGFRPSATYLFDQVARIFGPSATHVILTGMGQDGVEGLKIAAGSGGRVIAQDEASSVVFGMPGAAVAAGVVDSVLPLAAIGGELVQITQNAREGR